MCHMVTLSLTKKVSRIIRMASFAKKWQIIFSSIVSDDSDRHYMMSNAYCIVFTCVTFSDVIKKKIKLPLTFANSSLTFLVLQRIQLLQFEFFPSTHPPCDVIGWSWVSMIANQTRWMWLVVLTLNTLLSPPTLGALPVMRSLSKMYVLLLSWQNWKYFDMFWPLFRLQVWTRITNFKNDFS